MPVEVTARAATGEIRAKARYPEGLYLKQIPGAKWDKADKAWVIPATPAGALNLRLATKERGYVLKGDSHMAELIRIAKGQSEAFENVKKSGTLEQPEIRNFDAWRHQLEAFNFAKNLDAVMLNMEMGTGKTKVTIDVIQNDPNLRRILILCPVSVIGVWHREIQKHGVGFWNVPVLQGAVKKRAELSAQALADNSGRTVLIVNYEAAWREPLAKLLKGEQFDAVVFDEIHKIKAPGGVASRFCQALAKTARKKFGLTGTMMPGSPMDIYAQFRALNSGIFGTSFAKFRSRYAIMGGYGGYEVVDYQNQEELREKIRFMTYEVGADVLDLPEAIHTYRECQLGRDALRAYRGVENDFFAQVESGEITASNALVKLLRMRQITGGHVTDDDGVTTQIDKAKEKLLDDTLEDLGGEPTVIFCQFVADIDTIRRVGEARGLKVLELSGRVKQNFEFQEGEGDILVVQIQSGGVGIDLTRARYCIYYSVGFNLGEYLQSLARVHRPGQERSVTYIHLLAAGTVDQAVYNALQKKQDIVEHVLHGDLATEEVDKK